MGDVSLSELGAIVECLAAIGATKQIGVLIETTFPKPRKEDLEEHFSTWCRAPKEGEPPFEFVMGSPDGEVGRFDDEKQVEVLLTGPLWVMPTSVTYGQWKLMAPKADHMGQWSDDECLPVTDVSWFEASLYARWLEHWRRKLDRRPSGVPSEYRVALPTEAQREFFTRAGTTTRFWSGDEEADLDRVGWSIPVSDSRPHPVGEKLPNAWGVFDVHGNVWEWCHDWLHEDLPGGTDPFGPDTGRIRVLRGGSSSFYVRWCRSANRGGGSPDSAGGGVGFRLVLSAHER